MARKPAAELARRMMTILERGEYEVGGRTVSIAHELERAVAATREIDPDTAIAPVVPGARATRIEVTRETTLDAARRLHGEGLAPCALTFASARNPGGGFLNGARAQEESLARSSGLYACLSHRRMYAHHRERHDALYS
ncbi:MAG: TIGR02452 family protein, partial [Myxococcales bacterium]